MVQSVQLCKLTNFPDNVLPLLLLSLYHTVVALYQHDKKKKKKGGQFRKGKYNI